MVSLSCWCGRDCASLQVCVCSDPHLLPCTAVSASLHLSRPSLAMSRLAISTGMALRTRDRCKDIALLILRLLLLLLLLPIAAILPLLLLHPLRLLLLLHQLLRVAA